MKDKLVLGKMVLAVFITGIVSPAHTMQNYSTSWDILDDLTNTSSYNSFVKKYDQYKNDIAKDKGLRTDITTIMNAKAQAASVRHDAWNQATSTTRYAVRDKKGLYCALSFCGIFATGVSAYCSYSMWEEYTKNLGGDKKLATALCAIAAHAKAGFCFAKNVWQTRKEYQHIIREETTDLLDIQKFLRTKEAEIKK